MVKTDAFLLVIYKYELKTDLQHQDIKHSTSAPGFTHNCCYPWDHKSAKWTGEEGNDYTINTTVREFTHTMLCSLQSSFTSVTSFQPVHNFAVSRTGVNIFTFIQK